MPLIRRMPKRGFNNANSKTFYAPVNLESFNRFEDGARVDEPPWHSWGWRIGPGGRQNPGPGRVEERS